MIEVQDFGVLPTMLFSQVFDLSAEIPPESAVLDPGNGDNVGGWQAQVETHLDFLPFLRPLLTREFHDVVRAAHQLFDPRPVCRVLKPKASHFNRLECLLNFGGDFCTESAI